MTGSASESSIGIVALLVCLLFSSCSSLQITKRTHRPGYHIDLVKWNSKFVPAELALIKSEGSNDHHQPLSIKAFRLDMCEVPSPRLIAQARVVEETLCEKEPKQLVLPALKENHLEIPPLQSRHSKGNPDDEQTPWNTLGIVSFGIGGVGLILTVLGFSLLYVGFPGWLIALSITGLVIAFAGLITGIRGLVKSGGKKGKGFAITGLVSGATSIGFGIAVLFASLINLIVQVFS